MEGDQQRKKSSRTDISRILQCFPFLARNNEFIQKFSVEIFQIQPIWKIENGP
jgi:hypothetical protein